MDGETFTGAQRKRLNEEEVFTVIVLGCISKGWIPEGHHSENVLLTRRQRWWEGEAE